MKLKVWFGSFVALLFLVACSETTSRSPGSEVQMGGAGVESAADVSSPESEQNPASAAGEPLGHIKAKANEKTADIEFDVKTAILANFYDKFILCLSDVANDEVRTSGQFPPAPEDSGPYHRITLQLESVPSAPGEFPLKKLGYSVKDSDMHFNFGWSGDSLSGTVTLELLEGELPEEPAGIRARPAKVKGSFSATNTYGGVFSGTFEASGIPAAE